MSVGIVDFDSTLIQNQIASAHGFPEDTYADNTQKQPDACCSSQVIPVCTCRPSVHCMQLLPISLFLTAGEIQCQVCDMVVSATRTSSLRESKMQCNLTGV